MEHIAEDIDKGPREFKPLLAIEDDADPIFEKTWGHRMLAGLSVGMLVVAGLLIVFCAIQLVRFMGLAGINDLVTSVIVLCVLGIVGGLLLVPPAALGIYVAKHPIKVMWTIVAAFLALVLDIILFFVVVAFGGGNPVTAALYALLLALMPLAYLVAALKIRRTQAQ